MEAILRIKFKKALAHKELTKENIMDELSSMTEFLEKSDDWEFEVLESKVITE